MSIAQKITSMVLALRRKVNIKVRQPLQQIMIPAVDATQKAHIEAVADLLKNEVNVKEVNFIEGQGILVKKVKCNFRVMGKKFGKLMKAVNAAVTALNQDDINRLDAEGKLSLTVEGQTIEVERTDVDIISEDMPGWTVANEGALTVALDLEITPELKNEGIAREIVKRIQTFRKESGFEITDRINIVLEENESTSAAISTFGNYIASQVLADSITTSNTVDNANTTFDFDDFKLNVSIVKA